MPQYLLFKEKAKNYWCYLEFSQIISKNNKYGAGEKSRNSECDSKMDQVNKGVFLRISNDERIEQEWIQGTAPTQLTSSVDNGQQAVSAPHLGQHGGHTGTLLQSRTVRMLTVQIQKIQLKLLKQNCEITHISENSTDHPSFSIWLNSQAPCSAKLTAGISRPPEIPRFKSNVKKRKKRAFPPSNSYTHIT